MQSSDQRPPFVVAAAAANTAANTACIESMSELSMHSSENAHYYFFNQRFNGLVWKARVLSQRPDKDKESAKVYKLGHVMIKIKYESDNYLPPKKGRGGGGCGGLSDIVYCKVLLHNRNPGAHRSSIASEIIKIDLSPKAAVSGYESKPLHFTLSTIDVFDPM
jgi:hypothetical protein